ncbi:neocarzinostatin apoprotein domain-containing protein [Streptomyces sp. NPDC002104]
MNLSTNGRTCRLVLATAAALSLHSWSMVPAAADTADAAPATVRVSASTGLTDGQQVTVEGTGFRAGLTSVAVGLCKKGYTSNKDCDLSGGARLVTIGPDGSLPHVTLTAHTRVAGADCRTTPCVVGVAPLPSGTPPALIAANSVQVAVGFEGGTVQGEPSGTGRSESEASAASSAAPRIDVWNGPSARVWALSLAVAVAALALGALSLARGRRGAAPERPQTSPSHNGGSQ